MIVYRCLVYDKDQGAILSWHPNKREAEAALEKFQKERGEDACGPENVQAFAIPTNKTGLIQWLNAHFDSDNG